MTLRNAQNADVLVGLSEIQVHLSKRWKLEVSRQAIAYWIRVGLLWQPPIHTDAELVKIHDNRMRLQASIELDRFITTKQAVDAFVKRSGKVKLKRRSR